MHLVKFTNSIDEIIAPGLIQWDSGRTLLIELPETPSKVEVHFAPYKLSKNALVVDATIEDGVVIAPIPNILLQTASEPVAWVYAVDEASSKTIKTIYLPIEGRAKPTDYVYTEIEIKRWDDVTKTLESWEEDAKNRVVEEAIKSVHEIFTVEVDSLKEVDAETKAQLDRLTEEYNAKVTELEEADKADAEALEALTTAYMTKVEELMQTDDALAKALEAHISAYNDKVIELEQQYNNATEAAANAQTSANEAQTAAGNAQASANEAQETANHAIDAANSSQDTANNALEIVNDAHHRVMEAQNDIDNHKVAYEEKVSELEEEDENLRGGLEEITNAFETHKTAYTEKVAELEATDKSNADAFNAHVNDYNSKVTELQGSDDANASDIAAEVERAKEAEAKCVQQKAYSNAAYSPTFNDGDCARAYVRNLNGNEDSILVSKYTKPHALAMRDSNGKLFTLDPVDKNHCANKQYVDDTRKSIEDSVDKTIDDLQDSLGETLAENLINPDYRENDTSKKSHILNRPTFVGDGVESSNVADWSKNRYSFFLNGFNGGLHNWSEIGYPRDYYNADLIGDTMWAEKFLDDIARYSITVEQRTCRGSKDVTYYLSDATVKSDYGAYIIAVETDYYEDEDVGKQKLPLLVIYDRRTFNDHYHCSFPNEGVYLCEITFDHTSGGLHSDILSAISLEKREVKKLPNALVDFAGSTFLGMNFLNFKRATVAPKGGTFLLKPNMLAIIFPWNNRSCSLHSPNEVIFSNLGTSIVFTTDRFNYKYYDIAAFNFSLASLTSSSSHHNTYELTDSGQSCYIKNEYDPSNTGETGYVYVYYLERG